MNTRVTLIALASVLLFQTTYANYQSTPCEQTARQLRSACHLELGEDFRVTTALCLNLSDSEERWQCHRDAWSAIREERGDCGDQYQARREVCDLLGEHRYDPDPLEDPSINFVDMDDIGGDETPNPYFNLTVGTTYVLRAGDEFEEIVVVYVTDETAEVNDQECRIVVDAVVEAEEDEGEVDYEPAEFTDDLYLQDEEGIVYYCGEVSRNWEDGLLNNLDGSFISGEDAKGGILIKPPHLITTGESHRQEWAPGEAEDLVTYLDLATNPEGDEVEGFSCADAGGCLQTLDQAPLDPGSTELKYYIEGVGFVLAEAFEDGELTDEREELVCTGDGLHILFEDQCEIENPQELLEDLCDLASQFCPEEEGDD